MIDQPQSSFVDRYPLIKRAVELIEEDSGGHLLEFYGAGPALGEIVEAAMISASAECDEATLARIETYLASLTSAGLETLTQGAEHEIDAMGAPQEVLDFLERVFEAEITSE